MPKQRVEHVALHLAPRHHVEVRIVRLHVGEAVEPLLLLQPASLLALHLLDPRCRLVGELLGRRDLVRKLAHSLRNQLITQPRRDGRAAVLGDPLQKRAAVEVLAVAVIAAERAVERLVPRLDVAVAVGGVVGADDAAPALVVDPAQDHAVVRHPCEDVVHASVADLDRLEVGGIRWLRCHLQRGANLVQRVFAVRVELDQPRLETFAPALEVDAARHAAVAHRVCRAWVCVARLCDGLDRRREGELVGLLAERVAPLERPLACLHDPCRIKRRQFRLGTDIVQHHEQDVIAVLALGAGLAVREPIDDERPGVDVPRFVVLDLELTGQERRERRVRHAVRMVDQRAIAQLGLLPQQQRRLADLIGQLCHELDKLDAILTHRALLTCRNGPSWQLPRSAAAPTPIQAVDT